MKILNIIYYVFLVCAVTLILLLLFFVLSANSKTKILIVQSGSMEPAIKTGGIVVINPNDNYKAGDIITFGKISKVETPTTHRIVKTEIKDNQIIYITKGDANNGTDLREVKKSDIVGKVIFSLPYAGYVINFSKKPIVFVLLLLIPTATIIYEEIKKIRNEVAKNKTKTSEAKAN
ncbi:MAG: signal peptidase I [Candidatus Wolfebacteria bacterium]|nr:signal peptidase I [Candidatus Wolfebacteria bacterium]